MNTPEISGKYLASITMGSKRSYFSTKTALMRWILYMVVNVPESISARTSSRTPPGGGELTALPRLYTWWKGGSPPLPKTKKNVDDDSLPCLAADTQLYECCLPENASVVRNRLTSCVTEVARWCASRLRTKFTERAFSFSGPAAWNSLYTVSDITDFKNKLKAHLFKLAFDIQ